MFMLSKGFCTNSFFFKSGDGKMIYRLVMDSLFAPFRFHIIVVNWRETTLMRHFWDGFLDSGDMSHESTFSHYDYV